MNQSPIDKIEYRDGGEQPTPAAASGQRPMVLRQRCAIALWGLQVLAALIAAAAAAVDVESIMGTGPALAVTGLVLAIVARPARSWWVLAMSLSAPAVCVLCAALIVQNQWGPDKAQTPIAVILFVYVMLGVPLAVVALRRILVWPSWRRSPVWRYSMKSLLILVTAVCLLAAAARAVVTHRGVLTGYNPFVAFILVAAVLAGVALALFLKGRRR